MIVNCGEDVAVPQFHVIEPGDFAGLHTRRRLKQLAAALGLSPDTYDLRSNLAGTAVAGEITLHADRIYVQVSQSFTGYDSSILFRTCDGREDYVGGANNFASLDLLNRPRNSRAASRKSAVFEF
jgi:hypothetical protein